MDSFKKFSKVKKAQRVCLLVHIKPDADALCSMVVMRDFLVQQFKIPCVDMFAEGSMPNHYYQILGDLQINPTPKERYDAAIILDSPTADRTGIYESLYTNADIKINIDHHASNSFENCIRYFDLVSSTCEIVYFLLKFYKFKFSSSQLAKLYTGVLTDTDGFSVGAMTASTFKFVSACIDKVQPQNIYNNFLRHVSLLNQRLYALAINNIINFKDKRVLVTYIDKDQAKVYGACEGDYYGIINQLNTIYSVKFVCFIYPKNNEYHVSLRSKPGYDVSVIAKKFGGGGHIGASSYSSKDSIENITKQVVKEFRFQLKVNKEDDNKLF